MYTRTRTTGKEGETMEAYQGIWLDISGTEEFLPPQERDELLKQAAAAAEALERGACTGADFLGWRDLPARLKDADLSAAEAEGDRIAAHADALVVVGIGGSYLGAHAVSAALYGDGERGPAGRPELLFAGTGLCATGLQRVLDRLQGRDFHVCVISKSGTTLEPAVAFRILRRELHERYGDGAAGRSNHHVPAGS